MQIFAGEGPPEGGGTTLVVGLESQQPLFELGQRTEVVGGENFSLNDRQVDLDLVEPTGMDRGVDQNGVGPLGAEPVGGLLPAMSRTIVHDPEDPAGGPIGRLVHDLADQSIHRPDTIFAFAAPEDFGAMDVPRCQVGPRTLPKILVLDSHRASGSRRQGRLFAAPGLHTGLFIRREHEVIDAQRAALPHPLVQVQDPAGLGRKLRIARENPAAMLPGTQRIAAQPAPQSGTADLGNQSLSDNVPADFRERQAGQGQSETVRQFTGQRLNLNDETGGKSGWEHHRAAAHQDLESRFRKSVCATCSRSGAAYRGVRRSGRWTGLAPLTRRFWPVSHHDTVTYISALAPPAPDARLVTALLSTGSPLASRHLHRDRG